MTVTVSPTENLQGTIHLPASKSYSIRAFIIAACGGRSTIIRPSDCDDAGVAMAAARHMGASLVRRAGGVWQVRQSRLFSKRFDQINVKESGTVLRFLLPLLGLQQRNVRVVGEGTLKGRPNGHLLQTLRSCGMMIRGAGDRESVPIDFSGGKLRGGTMEIDGSLSSQFISALLIACPQLEEDTRISITGEKQVSSDYITMTQSVLAKSGVKVKKVHSRLFVIKGGQRFRGLKNFTVPSDYGLAAFLMAAAALVKSDVVFKGHFNDRMIQADGKILDFLRAMGVRFVRTKTAITMKGPFPLRGGTFSLKDCPDLVPIMAVLALFAKGKTRLCDIHHARAKESDRISDLRQELLKVGGQVAETENELIIEPGPLSRRDVVLNPHRDHRLAMAFTVLGLKWGVKISDMECVSKSYPGFVKDMRRLGSRISSKSPENHRREI